MNYKSLYIITFILVCFVGGLFAQNKALYFDGINDYVGFGDILDMGTNDMTASAWFKMETGKDDGTILGKSSYRAFAGRWSIRFETDILKVFFSPTSTTTISHNVGLANAFNNGVWHNITVVFDRSGYLEVYMDGSYHSRVSISAHETVNMNNTDIFMIGRYQNATGNGPHLTFGIFKGYIDEVRVWNVARTAVQIADEYNRELSTPQGGLIAYYKFNEIAPSQTATDETGSFNGALLPSGYANGPQWSDGPDISLPVELSSFSAALTAENYVTLKWVTQSETGLVGYRMYRNGTLDQATAISITSNIIDATNTSTTQIYNLTDTEVTIGDTYYYWLESIDMDHTTFYGPVSVYLSGTVVPVLPELTTMNNAYPNPFKANNNTNIEVTVKAGEKGNVTIYNILGQAVKTFPVNEGINSLNWNGNDSKGNACGNGIYFYKLATPSMNITKKMVIIK